VDTLYNTGGLSVCQLADLSVMIMSPAKQLNRWRCHSGYGLGWAQGSMY